jgi:hypothetical protein
MLFEIYIHQYGGRLMLFREKHQNRLVDFKKSERKVVYPRKKLVRPI